ECGVDVHGDAGRSAAALSAAGNVPVELAPEGLPADRGDRRGEVPVLQRELPAGQGLTPLLGHINLAHTYRGGERQTELLIRGLSAYLPRQRAVVRAGRPLAERLKDVPGVTVVPVDGRLGAVRAVKGCRLVHAHETAGAQ